MKLVIISFFILFSITIVSTTLGQGLIQEVCSLSNNKPNCIASLESNPDSQNATLQQLGIIALMLASSNATDTSLHIKDLLKDTTSLEPTVEQALRDCYERYLDAIEQLDDSLAAILANANMDVQTWVNAAIADIESCQVGFNGNDKVHVSPRNAMFRDLCNNVLAIVKLLITHN